MSKLGDIVEKNARRIVTRGTLARFLETLGDCIKAVSDMVHPTKE